MHFCITRYEEYPSDSYMPVSEVEAQDCMDAAKKLMALLKA